MPLITPLVPSRESVEAFHSAKNQQSGASVRDEKDSGYEGFEEFDDDCIDSDMEGSLLHRPRPTKSVSAPALPQRSAKRASTILDNVMLNLKSLDGTAPKEGGRVSMVQQTDPHELYLSSEEDASLSDDYEDSLFDFDASDDAEESTEGSSSRASSRRKSQEDTARVVSFTMVKPQIVNIFIPSNHASPISPLDRHSTAFESIASRQAAAHTESHPKATRRPSPLKIYPSSFRRLSVSSVTPSTYAQYSAPIHQNSSMMNLSTPSAHPQLRRTSRMGLSSLKTSISHASHSFLSSDPFSQSPALREEPEPVPEPPKTPNSLALWKRGFSRTLSKARKPSLPKISLAYTTQALPPTPQKLHRPATSAAGSRISSISRYEEREREAAIKRSETMPMTPTTPSVRRFEVVTRSTVFTPPPPPVPTSRENKKMSFGGLGRRRSIKGREGRYI